MDIKKLPKWAQDMIFHKDSEIRDLKEIITGLKLENPKSSVHYQPVYFNEPVYLPDDATIRFTFQSKRGNFLEDISVQKREDKLLISGNSRIAITPNASNSVYIMVQE